MSSEEIVALNRIQQSRKVHPFTCGNNRGSPEWKATHLDGEGVLVATSGGWECPYCDYKQAFSLRDPVLLGMMLGGT